MDASEEATPSGDRFRGQVLLLRGRAGLTQRALAAHLGISEQAIQKWEGGQGYPSPARLQALIALYLALGVFTAGYEAEEAMTLWHAARRMPPFDAAWFTGLRPAVPEGPAAPSPGPVTTMTAAPGRSEWQAWGEAPVVAGLQGRQAESTALTRWLVQERYRLVAVLGLGGIGKTALATHTARDLAPHFAGLCWRSLRNAPPPEDWLAAAIAALAPLPPVLPSGLPARLELLLAVLRERRCLLVLDNLETVLEPGEAAARYRAGYEGYGEVLRQVAESAHQSTLLLTGREAPPELALLAAAAPVRALHLGALDLAACRALLHDKGLVGDDDAWQGLVSRYGGNPLALNLVGQTIAELFGGGIDAMLAYAAETFGALFGGMRRLLEEQFGRLSALEQSLLCWLALEREPVGVAALRAALGPGVGPGEVLEALEALGRRSLLERGAERATHTLQPVVLEYVSERLVAALAQEVMTGEPVLLVSHAVVQATSRDYVRRSQERLIAQPLLDRLVASCGDAEGAERQLVELLVRWRNRPRTEQGYGPGNVVNLLRLLRGNLRGLDLSHLAIQQAYLQEVEVQDASLAGAHLDHAVLAEAFHYPTVVALSADGALLASGTSNGEVRLWRLSDRTPILSLEGHRSVIYGLALSADRRLIASGSLDGMVKLWEAADGSLLATLQEQSGGIWSVALSDDGQLVAGGAVDGTISVWESTVAHSGVLPRPSGRLLATLRGHTGVVFGVALRADGQLLVSGGQDGLVKLWEPIAASREDQEPEDQEPDRGSAPHSDGQQRAPWRQRTTLHGHTAAVRSVALSADGRLVVSGSYDGVVKLWEVPSGRLMATLQGHTGEVFGVAASPDGALVASAGADGTVKLWEAASGYLLATVQRRTGVIYSVALSADGRLVASAGQDGTITLGEVASGRPLATLQGHAGEVYSVAVSTDGQLVASGRVDGTIKLWEAASGHLLATVQGHTGVVHRVVLGRDGTLLASGGKDGLVKLWEATPTSEESPPGGRHSTPSSAMGAPLPWRTPGRQLAILQGHTGAVYGIALTADGRVVASGGADGTVRLWETASGRLLTTLQGHTGAIRDVALSGNGQLLASGGADGTVKLWEVQRSQLLATLHGHTGLVYGVALSLDGQVVASGSLDGTVKLWETASRRLLATLQGHAGVVNRVALSADGGLVASGGGDSTVKLWEVPGGRLLTTLQGHTAGVWGVALSADGGLVASGSLDGTVKLWAAHSSVALHTLQGDRRYERMDIARLTGVTGAQRAALLALGALDREMAPGTAAAPA